MTVGFAGLGLMGAPMAANLCHAGVSLTVYNRSPGPADALRRIGGRVAETPADLFAACDTVILMLADDDAADAVLGRGEGAFESRVAKRLIVNMGTHSPAWSRGASADVAAAGGIFVEAPVSGSRGPAERGELFAMLAGPVEILPSVQSLLAPMCREAIVVGAVPSATMMKLAVNLYLITSVTALAEAVHLAMLSGLDVEQVSRVIAEGPLGSSVAQAKLDKMIRRDFEPQAAIRDVVRNARLVAELATQIAAVTPLLDESHERFRAVAAGGGAAKDMAAILTSYEPHGVFA
jgi:3-hydroxyisobutyrate dehydrogenase